MDIINDLFTTSGGEEQHMFMILFAMVLATVLSLIITIVYQITFIGSRYSQSFVHTIIMISVIVSIVMIVFSDYDGVTCVFFTIFLLLLIRFDLPVAND